MTEAFDISVFLPLLPGFLLVLARVGGLIIFVPFFGSAAIPVRLRIALVVVLSLALFGLVGGTFTAPADLGHFVVALAGEFAVGLIIGLGAALIFVGVRLAGLLIGQQIGISLADVFDPSFEGQSSILGRLFFMLTLVLFLLFDGHRVLIGSLVDSFGSIGPGSFDFSSLPVAGLTSLLWQAYLLALRFAAPALVAVFLATVSLSFVARTIPQLNIISVGFPVQISTATLVLIVSLGSICLVFQTSLAGALESVSRLFGP
ncbi:MAG: hypothetical protein GWP14_08905 [Actinobacteria bacterium]|nr:hypothetical protein [Actinomycetota bacterium]